MMDDDGNEMDLKQMEQEELKEETTTDLSSQQYIADAFNDGLTIKNELEEEIPEAAEVGFDDMGSDEE
jgi:DNA-directed RNA polymerase subunit beta